MDIRKEEDNLTAGAQERQPKLNKGDTNPFLREIGGATRNINVCCIMRDHFLNHILGSRSLRIVLKYYRNGPSNRNIVKTPPARVQTL